MPLLQPSYVTFVATLPASGFNGQLVYNQADNSIYMWENGFWALVSVLPTALTAENGEFLMTENNNNIII